MSIVVLKIFRGAGIRKIADHSKTEIDDLLIKVIQSLDWPFYAILSLWVIFQFIALSEKIEKYFSYFALITLIFYTVKAIQESINFGTTKFIERREKEGKKVEASAINLLNTILKTALWVMAFLLILQNLGFQITTLIAGLGVGGIAIAFALQTILSDIFACFAIYFDKPFEIGDFIIVGEHLGIVNKVGIKSTRIKSL